MSSTKDYLIEHMDATIDFLVAVMESKKGFTDPNIARIDGFLEKQAKSISHYCGIPVFASLEISINGACTRRCSFCPRVEVKEYPNILKSLEVDIYKRLINSLAENSFKGRLSFSGFCEPLLTRNICEYIEIARHQLKENEIEIVTNADLLPRDQDQFNQYVDRLFESGLTMLRISVYDGIKSMTELTRLKEGCPWDKQIMLRRRYMDDSGNIGITISNRAGSVKVEGLTEGEGSELPLNAPCYYPFYKMLIDYNGDTLICSNDWKKKRVVGNVHNTDIYDIWISKEFEAARMQLSKCSRNFEPCNACDVEGTLNGLSYFEAWNLAKQESK